MVLFLRWMLTPERHKLGKSYWLRSAVLSAVDGILSLGSLLIGLSTAGSSRSALITAGIAGTAAGAFAMSVGEYVSVSSQRDAERADVEKEKYELANFPEAEMEEIVHIYMDRGLSEDTARVVAEELCEKDLLATHVRDELGFTPGLIPHPFVSGGVAAVSFVVGVVPAILAVLLSPSGFLAYILYGVSVAALIGLGAAAGVVGGASPAKGALRVSVGGGLAMGVTALIGFLTGMSGL